MPQIGHDGPRVHAQGWFRQVSKAGPITDGVLRVSVGLEDVRDLVEDVERALA